MRGRKYLDAIKLIDKNKAYPIEEAIELVKKTSTSRFDGSVELHARLGVDASKSEEQVRGVVNLPHGTGKTQKVIAFTNKIDEAKQAGAELAGGAELIEEIKKSGKCDFDVAVADIEMMKPLAVIAKILGPKGLMPSPKNETVTKNIGETIKQLKKGKTAFKSDDTGNVHLAIGKISFSTAQLAENFQTAIETIRKVKPAGSKGAYLRNLSLSATMGPGVKIAI
ncbi:MAG: 50S ribosomal protein L1 [Parcubacteria group bacterium]|nr:50S ribosomal protein L1 [Parcubacteria group bacterium]